MTFEELMELRRTQGQEAADKVLKTLSLEQIRDIVIDANKAVINLANLAVATYVDYAVESALNDAHQSKQKVDSLIKRMKELK